MNKEWKTLTELTQGRKIIVERVRIIDEGIAVEGSFDLPPMAVLTADDQTFVAAFVRCHGSIKQMEKFFGVSYPTIKNRLNRIGNQLDFVKIESEPVASNNHDALDRLNRGEIDFEQAMNIINSEETNNE